jgi:O-antigen ligase
MTMSRGSWLSLFIALTLILYEIFWKVIRNRLKAFVLVVMTISIMSALTLFSLEDVRNRLFEDDYGSAIVRIPMASVAINMIKENPLRGVGLNNYTNVMHRYDRTREWQTYQFPHPVHNSYLLIAAESGLPALIVFLWLMGVSLERTMPKKATVESPAYVWQVGLSGSLITWVISAIFDRDFAGTNFMMWFVIALMASSSGNAYWVEEKESIDEE